MRKIADILLRKLGEMELLRVALEASQRELRVADQHAQKLSLSPSRCMHEAIT